jgi:lysozyme
MTGINSIIDLSHHHKISAKTAKESGVVAIIHKATEGVDFYDKEYPKAKVEAKAIGLLWGSYHFSNNKSPAEQVKNYLSYAKPEDDELICLDFEHNNGNEMSLEQAEKFVTLIKKELGRFPMLYGGAWLREQVKANTNAILAQCPLWYRRYASTPKELPTQIWPTYTLWQYTDGKEGASPKSVNGIACDRNFFQGTESELKAAWPFTRRE